MKSKTEKRRNKKHIVTIWRTWEPRWNKCEQLFLCFASSSKPSTELAFYVNWKTSDQRKYEEAKKKLRAKSGIENKVSRRKASWREKEIESFGEKRRANNIRVQDASTRRK